uniref:WxxW domain-containing protein n=1 Tax=Neogobius melanostomus TaxID=47308 RepID=A0A8C6SRR1_9GOBI
MNKSDFHAKCRSRDTERLIIAEIMKVFASCFFFPDCWTEWFDWKTLVQGGLTKICPQPIDIEVTTKFGESAGIAREIVEMDKEKRGFVCKSEDKCSGYRVRFSCPPKYCAADVCWTDWFDRSDPSGTGDYETLSQLQKEYPGKICRNPSTSRWSQ